MRGQDSAAMPAQIPLGFYAVPWALYLALYATALVASRAPLDAAVRNAIANVVPDAIAGLAVLGIAGRLASPERRRWQWLAVHAGWFAAFVAAATAGWVLLVGLDGWLFQGAFRVPPEAARFVPWRILIDLLIYGALVGAVGAWRNAAASRAQAARAARAEALRARAELEALRSQLNPHFIFNTIHALVGLVRRDPEVAEAALERLGDLLRYSLRISRENADRVTLREEWAFVESYLELERLRLGDRLRVSFDAAPAALAWLVPTFALQTLVENAIRHAIATRAAGGHLAVSAHEIAGRLNIRVEDDGPDGAAPASEGAGIGLRLLRERLAALYDGAASLTLEAGARGARAVIELPAHAGPR